MQNYEIEQLKDAVKERVTIEAGEKLIDEINMRVLEINSKFYGQGCQSQRMDYDINCLKARTYGPTYGSMLEDDE